VEAVGSHHEPPQCPPASTGVVASPPAARQAATSPRPPAEGPPWSPSTKLTASLGRYTNPGVELVRRAVSWQGRCPPPAERPRPIMVRHEETHATLARRLGAICGGGRAGSEDRAPATAATDHEPPGRRAAAGSKLTAPGGGGSGGGEGGERVRIKADVQGYLYIMFYRP